MKYLAITAGIAILFSASLTMANLKETPAPQVQTVAPKVAPRAAPAPIETDTIHQPQNRKMSRGQLLALLMIFEGANHHRGN